MWNGQARPCGSLIREKMYQDRKGRISVLSCRNDQGEIPQRRIKEKKSDEKKTQSNVD